MLAYIHHRIARFGQNLTQRLEHRLIAATKPAAPVVLAGTLADLTRSKPALVAENAMHCCGSNSSSCGGVSSARAAQRLIARFLSS